MAGRGGTMRKAVTRGLLCVATIAVLVGCAAPARKLDVVSFDRAQFAFMLGDVKLLIDQKCRRASADKVECARLFEQFESIKRQVSTPPVPDAPNQQFDLEQMIKLLGICLLYTSDAADERSS